MKIRNEVHDADFDAAWADVDNQRMMRSVASRYRPHLAREEVDQFMRLGLLDTLKTHDYASRRKFITSLRLRTLWVFKTQARTSFRRRRLEVRTLDEPPSAVASASCEREVELRDAVAGMLAELSDEERVVARHYYMDDYSLAEICRRTGMSRRRVEGLHQSGTCKLKYLASNLGERYVDHATAV